MSNFTKANDNNFKKEVLNSDKLVLVDFWASWCGPCKMIAPIVQKLSDNYKGQLKVVKFNTEESQGIPQNFGITGIPTVMLFKNGSMKERITGVRPYEMLAKIVEKYLK